MDPNVPSRDGYAEVGSASADEVTVSLDHNNNNNGAVPTDVNTVPMPADQTAAGSVPPSLEGEFLHRPMEHIEKIGLPFKIHAGVGLGVTVLCFFIWHWTSAAQAVWWWIFPGCFFGATCALHWHFSQGHRLEGIITATIVLNVMMYMTFVTLQHDFPWWIYPAIASGMVLVPVWYRSKQHPTFTDLYNVIWFEYWFLNLALFLTWANALPLGHPWFFYPLIILAIPLIVYRMRTYYKETRIPVLVGVPLVMVNLCFFIGWGFSPAPGPWFLIPLAICVGIEALLIWRFRAHTTHEVIPDQAPEQQSNQIGGDAWASPTPYHAAPVPAPQPTAYPSAYNAQPAVGYNNPTGYNTNPFGNPQ